MKRISITLLSLLLWCSFCEGQSKVFKEVSKDIESKVEAIMQENTLVGYLVFTKLEKISKDSFAYKINFLDENLNDIGEYKFKNQNLEIHDVVYDQEILCIGYLRNNAPQSMASKTFKSTIRNYSSEVKKIKSSIYLQFLDLKGKLVNEYSETVNTTFYEAEFQTIYAGLIRNSFRGSLRTPIKIRNIPNKGFCITYTESNFVNGTKIKTGNEVASASCKQKIQVFDFNGNSIWKGQLPESKVMYSIPLTSENNIYILRKNYKKDVSIPNEGEYDLLSLNSNNGNVQKQEKIGDNSKNSFHVLNFSNELNLDMPVISGLITKQGASIKNIHYASRGEYYGVFNIKAKDSTFKKQISYWSDGQLNPEISKSSYIKQTKTYPNISYSFPDAEGNVYYIGPGIVKKTRWGSVTAAVLTSPTLVIPAWIFMFGGIHKYKNKDELVLKQDVNGKLSFHSSQVVNNNKIKHLTGNPNTEKSYFTVNQNKYLVINDREDIFVLDIPNKSLVKKIPHKQGDNKVEVFKAKEGHIMLSEHNSEDGSTKLSIEAL